MSKLSEFFKRKKSKSSKENENHRKTMLKEFQRLVTSFYSPQQWETIECKIKESKERKEAEEARIYKGFEKILTPELMEGIDKTVEESGLLPSEIDQYCRKHVEGIDTNKYIEMSKLRRKKRIEEQREVSKHLDEVLGPKDLTH